MQDVPRQLGLRAAPPTAKVIDSGLSSAAGAGPSSASHHAAVTMAECALRVKDGDAAVQVYGGRGHVLLGQREAGEVNALRGHPVLHQALAS